MQSSRREVLVQLGGVVAGAWATNRAVAQPSTEPTLAPTQHAPIRIGQIGVGHAHASKLAVYRASAEYEVVGIVEPDEALRAGAQDRDPYRGLPWMTQPQLLNTPGLQAVLVETRVRDLLSTAEACIAAGMHVHLDKPAGESYPQYERLLAAATRQNRMVQMGYMYRYNPAVVLLRDMLRRGWLGDIFEVHAVMSKSVGLDNRRQLAEYAGGMMFELGGHLMDLVVGVLGAPDRVTSVARHVASTDDGLLDNMLAVCEYPRAIATIKSAALEVEGNARRHLVVCGSEGTLQIQPLDKPAVRLALATPRGDYTSGYQDVAIGPYTRYVDDAADMARFIRGEQENRFPPAHDLAVQKALLLACGLPLGPANG